MKQYYCPTCSEELSHVGTEKQLDEGLKWYRVHLECMHCPEIMSVTISVPRAEDLPEGGVEREVRRVDSRDDHTTWLWISDDEYIEVDPVELHHNMLMNCC